LKCHADRLVWRPAAIDHAQSDEGAPIPQASALDKRSVPGNRGFIEDRVSEIDAPNTDEA